MKLENRVPIPQIEVGDTAPKFISALAQMNPLVRSLSFTIYSPIPVVEERLGDLKNRPVAEVVTSFLHHDNSSNQRWQVLASELTAEIIIDKIATLPNNLALAIESKCILHDASIGYIPMMDFKPNPSGDNLELLKEFLKRLAFKGILVDSGASYHFYGFDLLAHTQWIMFMGECLLVPWSDSRWIGHSLIAGGGDLRISATKQKPKHPSVCDVLK